MNNDLIDKNTIIEYIRNHTRLRVPNLSPNFDLDTNWHRFDTSNYDIYRNGLYSLIILVICFSWSCITWCVHIDNDL